MPDPRFVLDEATFRFGGDEIGAIPAAVERFGRLAVALRERDGQALARPAALWEVEWLPGRLLGNFLYDRTQEILDRESIELLRLVIDRCEEWEDDADGGDDVTIAGVAERSATVAAVWRSVASARAVACLCLAERPPRGGSQPVAAGGSAPVEVHFVVVETHARDFYRAVPEIEDFPIEQYLCFAPVAFRGLRLLPEIAHTVGSLSRPFRALRAMVTQHLAALNDHFPICFLDGRGDKTVGSRFRAATGVDVSLESPNVHADASAMRERRARVAGVDLLCEWHTKLFPDRDRIYFHQGHPQAAAGRIIVKHIGRHL